MKLERLNGRDYTIHYPSFADLLSDRPKGAHNERIYKDITRDRYTRGWFGIGCDSGADFIKRVENGWPALTESVKQMANELTFKPDVLPPMLTQSMRRKRTRGDTGTDLDIHAVYQGQLDRAWSTTRRDLQNVRRRAAHVYLHIGGSGADSAADSRWRAASAYRICEIFQRSGFSVEITVGATADNVYSRHSVRVHTSFTAKASSVPLDLNRLALQATLGWHRVFNFMARACNDLGLECSPGFGVTDYGAVSPYVEERCRGGEIAIIVPAHISSKLQAEKIVRQAQELLEAFARKSA